MDHARKKKEAIRPPGTIFFYVFLVTLVLASLITHMQDNRGIFASSSSMKMEGATPPRTTPLL